MSKLRYQTSQPGQQAKDRARNPNGFCCRWRVLTLSEVISYGWSTTPLIYLGQCLNFHFRFGADILPTPGKTLVEVCRKKESFLSGFSLSSTSSLQTV